MSELHSPDADTTTPAETVRPSQIAKEFGLEKIQASLGAGQVEVLTASAVDRKDYRQGEFSSPPDAAGVSAKVTFEGWQSNDGRYRWRRVVNRSDGSKEISVNFDSPLYGPVGIKGHVDTSGTFTLETQTRVSALQQATETAPLLSDESRFQDACGQAFLEPSSPVIETLRFDKSGKKLQEKTYTPVLNDSQRTVIRVNSEIISGTLSDPKVSQAFFNY